MKKAELLKKCATILQKPKVSNWYQQNMEKQSQAETINSLETAVSQGELSIREALSICLIVGVQWNVKFEGSI